MSADVKKDPAGISALYGEGEQTGHFFPVQFKPEYYGKAVELSGRTDGNRTVTLSEQDPYLIVRLENLSAGGRLTAKVKATLEEVFELDFSGVTKEGDV